MKVLLWEYEIKEWIDYPDPNSLGSIRWNEIIDINFFWCDTNVRSVESLGSTQYRHFFEALEYDAHDMNEADEIDFVLHHLKQQDLATPENIGWVHFWVSYQHDEWTRRYEKRKAERAASAQTDDA